MKKIKPRKLIGWVVALAIGLFFYRALARNWSNVRELEFSFGYEAVLALALFALAIVFTGLLWNKIFYRLSTIKAPALEAIRVEIGSWLLKYLPGQVGALIYKLEWGKSLEVSRKVTAAAFAYQYVFMTLASTVVIVPIILLTLGDQTGVPLLLIYILGLAAFGVLSHRLGKNIFLQIIKKITKLDTGKKYLLDFKEIAAFSTWFSIPRFLNGAGFVILASSFLAVTPNMILSLAAIYIFAGIVGLYAFFVPSGLGVREAVIVAFASVYFTTEEAIVLSLLARLYATAADGLVALVYAYLTKRNKSSDKIEIV